MLKTILFLAVLLVTAVFSSQASPIERILLSVPSSSLESTHGHSHVITEEASSTGTKLTANALVASSTPVIPMNKDESPYIIILNTQYQGELSSSSICGFSFNILHDQRDLAEKYKVRFIYSSGGKEYLSYSNQKFKWYQDSNNSLTHDFDCKFPSNFKTMTNPNIRVEVKTRMYAKNSTYKDHTMSIKFITSKAPVSTVLPGPIRYKSMSKSSPSYTFKGVKGYDRRQLTKVKFDELLVPTSKFTMYLETHNVYFSQKKTVNCTLDDHQMTVKYLDKYSAQFSIAKAGVTVKGENKHLRCYDASLLFEESPNESSAFGHDTVFSLVSDDEDETGSITDTTVNSSTKNYTLIIVIVTIVAVILILLVLCILWKVCKCVCCCC